MDKRDESNPLPSSKRMHVDLAHEPSSETMVDDSEYSYSDNSRKADHVLHLIASEDPLIPTNDIHVVDNRSYVRFGIALILKCIRPARILISVEEFVGVRGLE